MAEPVDCPVCYEEIVDHPAPPGKKATGSTKTSCGHSFHPGCIATWYVKHTECPCCRAEATEFEKPKLPTLPSKKNKTVWAIHNLYNNYHVENVMINNNLNPLIFETVINPVFTN